MDEVSPTTKMVADEVKTAVVQAVQDPRIPLSSTMPHIAASDVAQKVADAVELILAHVNDSEPWYRSRVVWGAIIGVFGTVGALFGLQVSDAQVMSYTNLAVIVGPVIVGALTALWGRYVARKPLGT